MQKTTIASRYIFVLLLVHSTLLAYQACVNAPNLDETAHLPSGLSHWTFGDFTLYRVNPPLIRAWAALPLLIDHPEVDWSDYSNTPFSRSEFSVGRRFNKINGVRTFWYFTLARWVLIPVSLIGAWVCYRWSVELYGPPAGLLSVTLWCFCPNLLAWGASITPDMASAAFGVLAAWRFWKWLHQQNWSSALGAGLALGVAELTKSTWIVLFGLWPIIWAAWYLSPIGKDVKTSPLASVNRRPPFMQLLLVLGVGLYLLNLGYAFEKSGQPLGEFTFISKALGGPKAHDSGGNRFQGSLLRNFPVPVPANYLIGIDVQKYDFEREKWSYLCGEQKRGGWLWYYAYAFLVKTPLGFLGLIIVATILFCTSLSYRGMWRDELFLILPGLIVFLLVSSQTGFNRYLRYILPAFPFAYIFASRLAISFTRQDRRLSVLTIVLVTIGVLGSVSVTPNFHSYFNQSVGGPVKGRYHLLDGNIDWGQDLLRFREWYNAHPEARPLQVALTTLVPLEAVGLRVESIGPHSDATEADRPLKPGWYAVGTNELMGYHMLAGSPDCSRFQQLSPKLTIGYTIHIYHVEE